jgi:dTDP-4-dehydrorhamnose reductase
VRALVTGGGGMLGGAVSATLRERGHEVVSLDRAALDVTDAAAVHRVIDAERPQVVMHCAAYTQVDAAESDPATAFLVNAEATGLVASACQRIGALVVYPSTDYVFAGTAREPYRPEDPTSPINHYGRSKLAGEQAVLQAGRALVVRTSWLYGSGGKNFVDTITRLAAERDRLEVVADQTGRPTWTGSLAQALARLAEVGASGVFHVTDGGPPVTWFDFAEKILSLQNLRVQVVPVGSDALARPAARPAFSVLDCSKAEIVLKSSLALWQDTLSEYLGRGTENRFRQA